MSRKYTDEELMALAIEEMKKSVPDFNRTDGKINPKVGTVMATPDGELLSTAHRGELRDGDHAEFTVLERKNRDRNLTGMVLYATLEPCAPGARNHPKLSCAERIFNARLSKVFIGYIDPDPTVAGEGRDFLSSNGIEVDYFPKHLQDKIYQENKKFFDDAEIRAKQESERQLLQPAKPLEKVHQDLEIHDFSEEAQLEVINRMELPFKVGDQQFNKFLAELHLIEKTEDTSACKPTGLGLLLLGKNPQAAYPQARVKFTIEQESDEPFTKDIEGPILLMPGKIEDFLDSAFLSQINRDNFHRKELTKIPKKLLRELIINAIVHRDYLVEGAQIKVVANKDKIEIWSPGRPLFDLEQFRTFDVPSQSTNPKIAYLFYKTKLVEERNIGMKELKGFSETHDIPQPSFEMRGDYFVVTVFRSRKPIEEVLDDLSKSQIELYKYIIDHGPVRSSDYAKVIGKTERTVRNYFKGMEKVLKRVGSGPETRYEIKND